MNCPRCENVILDERERDGVVVDVCRNCRGLWLDRGELEKIIARSARESDELFARASDAPPRGAPMPSRDAAIPSREHQYGDRDYRDRDYRDDDDDHRYDRRYPKRKKNWFETLGDIFD